MRYQFIIKFCNNNCCGYYCPRRRYHHHHHHYHQAHNTPDVYTCVCVFCIICFLTHKQNFICTNVVVYSRCVLSYSVCMCGARVCVYVYQHPKHAHALKLCVSMCSDAFYTISNLLACLFGHAYPALMAFTVLQAHQNEWLPCITNPQSATVCVWSLQNIPKRVRAARFAVGSSSFSPSS